jgi:hypothetical protein
MPTSPPVERIKLPPLVQPTLWTFLVSGGLTLVTVGSIGIALLAIGLAAEPSRDSMLWFLLVSFLTLIVSAVSGISFIAWAYLSHRNLEVLSGPRTQFSSASGAIMMLIPLVNILVAAAMLHDLILGSDPHNVPGRISGRGRAKTDILFVWLGCCIIGLLLNLAAYFCRPATADLAQMSTVMVLTALAASASAIQAIALQKMILSINANQQLRHQFLCLHAPVASKTAVVPEFPQDWS